MRLFIPLILVFATVTATAQPPQQKEFLRFQKSFKTVSDAFYNKEDSLKAQFAAKGLVWPAKYLYIRSFKYDSQMEVWVKDKKEDPYRLFKIYKICALAGNLGPKRFQGDFQVPEGFYYFNEFRPRSNYHLALGVNYPNPSDRVLSDSISPGGDIYVHGSCVTVGCIPLTDSPIEELYVLAANTRNAGQDYIPVHVFPVKFRKKKSREVLDKFLATRPDYQPMVKSLESVYYYFNEHRQIPTVLINKAGNYFIAEDYHYTPPKKTVFVENSVPRKKATKTKVFTEKDFFPSVYKVASYPGGLTAFQAFIDELQDELTDYLPPAQKRIFVQVDFVIDKEGNLVNVKVGDNANNEINNLILERFEAMPKWSPAIRQEPVAIRLQQTIMITARPMEAEADEDAY